MCRYAIHGSYGQGMVVARCRRVKYVKSTKKKLSFVVSQIFPSKIEWDLKKWTPKSGLGVRSVGVVGDFLEFSIFLIQKSY